MYIAHWMACVWKLPEATNAATSATLAEAYALSYYDALQLLQGQGLATESLEQNLFAAFAVLVGSIVLAVVFGHVAILVSNFNANSTNYQRKLEAIFAVMTKLQLPVLLRDRIHQYYEHLWREYESLDGQLIQFSKELMHTLGLEVLLFKYMAVIMHIPFWHEATPDFLKQIVLNIQVRVYLPDNYIKRRGEIGDEYYIINRGFCELLTGADSFERASAPLSTTLNRSNRGSRNSIDRNSVAYDDPDAIAEDSERDSKGLNKRSKKYRTVQPKPTDEQVNADKLSRGQSFGEMALIMNYQRTGDARAITYVEMCVLKRENFQRILVRYPHDRKRVITRILTNMMVNNELHNVHCPLKSLVRSVFGSFAEDKSISANQAAELIMEVINIEKDDDTLKFGIDIQLEERLKVLCEQKRRVLSSRMSVRDGPKATDHSSSIKMLPKVVSIPVPVKSLVRNQPSARFEAMQTRMVQVEVLQRNMFTTIQQMNSTILEMKRDQDRYFALPNTDLAFAPASVPASAPEPVVETHTVASALDPTSSNIPISMRPDRVRRSVSAPSADPQVLSLALQAEQMQPQLVFGSPRRHSQTNMPYAHRLRSHHSRGLRPLLRRVGSVVGLYPESTEEAPVQSVSQYAAQLFQSQRHTSASSSFSRRSDSKYS